MGEASQRVVTGTPSQTRRPRRPRLGGGRASGRLILSWGAAKRPIVMHFLAWSHGPREPILGESVPSGASPRVADEGSAPTRATTADGSEGDLPAASWCCWLLAGNCHSSCSSPLE